MNFKSRYFISSLAITIIVLSVIFLLGAVRRLVTVDAQTGRTGTYNLGGFSFTAPLQVTRPATPSPPTGVTILNQDLEPEIKTDVFGNLYITAINGVPGGTDLWKSINKGASFVYLGHPDGLQDKCGVAPLPPCAVGAGGADDSTDVSSGGYLYISSLSLANSTVSTSMNGGTGGLEPGQAWQVNPISGIVPVEDRQWLAAYGPQTVYMTFKQAPGTGDLFFVKSIDAGKTFTSPVMLTGIVSRESNLVVDQFNGNIYANYTPNGVPNQINLLRSTNGGASFTTVTGIYTGPANTTVENAFTNMAVDRGGNLHLAFSQCALPATTRTSCHIYLTSSSDQGATWLPAIQVDSGVGSTSAVMPWIAAGSPGVVDLTWYGTTNPSPDAASSILWHAFFAQTRNAMDISNVAFNQVQITTDPVHDKAICARGTGCATGTRDLAEYYTMTVDADGKANIALVDGINNCPAASCVVGTWFTKQVSGATAYSPPAAPAPATFSANLALPSSTGDAEPGIAVDSHGCVYAHAPGDPDTWYSEDNGATFTNVIPPTLPTGGGDEDIVTVPKQDGSRDDAVYLADLALADVSIRKSTDRGHTWFSPGTGGSAGEMDASSDRQWIIGDRINMGANQVLYEMDHELASEAIRFSASIDDSAWSSPPASGITEPEMILPPNSTFPNTNPGPIFVDKATHKVYGFFTGATIKTNRDQPPFGKMPNVWEADGPGAITAGVSPGPFVNHPVFKGLFDSPTNPAPPAGTQTFGTNTANDFPSAAIDAAGNIYVVWAMNNARTNQFSVWFASSHDHGATYYGPFEVATFPSSPNGSAEMPWIAAGDDGRVNIVYYQSNDFGNPNSANLHWNTMFAQSLNAASREPVFTVSQASDHIMHFGPICNMGLLCASGTRVLLDFFKVAISTDGMAHITFADTGSANSPSHVTYTKQLTGPGAVTNPVIPACVAAPTPTCTPGVNVALGSNGSTAVASTSHASGNFPAASAINGDRTGATWGSSTGGWNDGTRNVYPDILEVDFPVAESINQINVFTLQNNWTTAGEPTLASPATGEGILDFIVSYCSAGCGTGTPTWTTVVGGDVTGNDKAWRQFNFPDVTTSKIRVVVNNSRNNWSRIVELEALRSCP